MMEGELDMKLEGKIPHPLLYLHTLGPVPRLVQYACQFLRAEKWTSLVDLNNHLRNKIEGWLRVQLLPRDVALILLAMIEQQDLSTIDTNPKFLSFGPTT